MRITELFACFVSIIWSNTLNCNIGFIKIPGNSMNACKIPKRNPLIFNGILYKIVLNCFLVYAEVQGFCLSTMSKRWYCRTQETLKNEYVLITIGVGQTKTGLRKFPKSRSSEISYCWSRSFIAAWSALSVSLGWCRPCGQAFSHPTLGWLERRWTSFSVSSSCTSSKRSAEKAARHLDQLIPPETIDWKKL